MPFDIDGFKVIEDVVPESVLRAIINEWDQKNSLQSGAGIRNAEKKLLSIKVLAKSSSLLSRVSGYLTGTPHLVRSILFNKSSENNWRVGWHQDKTIAVSSRFELSGWGPWSVKDGTLHVQPPLEVLNQMVTFRIHIDESTRENGCLKLIPGSFKGGILSEDDIASFTEGRKPSYCVAPVGSALVMRPHVLHSSGKVVSNSPRRVLHLEYSCYELPGGVYWA